MDGNQKFCPSCGASNEVSSNFCISCGARFADFAPTPPPVAAAPVPSVTVTPPPMSASGRDFITLACPNCGGKLQITPDIERFACQYCGYEHIVRRSGGIVSLEPVMQMMGQLNTNIGRVDSNINRISGHAERQASEAAIVRLKEEIDELIKASGKADDSKRNIWLTALFFAWPAVSGIIIGFAEEGVDSDIQHIAFIVGGIFIFFTVMLIVAAIAQTAGVNKKNQQRSQQIAQKQAELAHHYQVVSNSK